MRFRQRIPPPCHRSRPRWSDERRHPLFAPLMQIRRVDMIRRRIEHLKRLLARAESDKELVRLTALIDRELYELSKLEGW